MGNFSLLSTVNFIYITRSVIYDLQLFFKNNNVLGLGKMCVLLTSCHKMHVKTHNSSRKLTYLKVSTCDRSPQMHIKFR